MIRLDRQDHSNEGSRDRDHRDALDADGVKNGNENRPACTPADDPHQRENREIGDITDFRDDVKDLFSEPVNRCCARSPGTGGRAVDEPAAIARSLLHKAIEREHQTCSPQAFRGPDQTDGIAPV